MEMELLSKIICNYMNAMNHLETKYSQRIQALLEQKQLFRQNIDELFNKQFSFFDISNLITK